MTLEMIDREIWFSEADGQTFRVDAPIMSELARPGPLVAAKASISPNVIFADRHRALEQTRRVHQMIARRDFRNDAAVFFVLRDLRCDFAREQLGRFVRARSRRPFRRRTFRWRELSRCVRHPEGVEGSVAYLKAFATDPSTFARDDDLLLRASLSARFAARKSSRL